MAVFDVIVNNADRKGAHIRAMPTGHRHGVDHGLTFHVEDKLRTVLWGWLGGALSEEERDGVGRVLEGLDGELGRGWRSYWVPKKSTPWPNAVPSCSTTGVSLPRAGRRRPCPGPCSENRR